MYIWQLVDDSLVYMILYVDNILITGNDKVEIRKLKQNPHEKFSMMELREAPHILSMQIEWNRTKKILWLSQLDIYLEGAEALQHGACETVADTASDVVPTIE